MKAVLPPLATLGKYIVYTRHRGHRGSQQREPPPRQQCIYLVHERSAHERAIHMPACTANTRAPFGVVVRHAKYVWVGGARVLRKCALDFSKRR